MTRTRSLSLLLIVALALFALACGGQAPEAPAETEPMAEAPSAESAPAAQSAEAMPASYSEGESVSLTGTLGCGHCNFSHGEQCSAAMQTAEGELVVLEVPADHELFTKRFEGGQLEVEGTVTAVNEGVPYVELTTYTLGG